MSTSRTAAQVSIFLTTAMHTRCPGWVMKGPTRHVGGCARSRPVDLNKRTCRRQLVTIRNSADAPPLESR
jgi:hypothetical protein